MNSDKSEVKLTPPQSGCLPSMPAIEDALYVIGGKWKLKIIVMLFGGSKRFNDLQKSITGISARILSLELKSLELNGFIIRTVHSGTPAAVDYQLAPHSQALRNVVHSLEDLGVKHRVMIKSMSK